MATGQDMVASVQAVTIPNKISELGKIAKDIADFVNKQKLFTVIKGKKYAHVEAWQFAGANLGVLPIVRKVEKLSSLTSDTIEYRAEIELQDRYGNPVGGGVAICSKRESGREHQDEYVIASMAQTRAIGKAYRNSFGWLLKLAGYQSLPAEEATDNMDDTGLTIEEQKEAIKNQYPGWSKSGGEK